MYLRQKLSEFLEAGVHIGHKSDRWNPKMFAYIYKEVNNIHILDLAKSARQLKKAHKYLEAAAAYSTEYQEPRKTFLFVGTKPQAAKLIAEQANFCGANYVNHRWLGGMLTNWRTFKGRIEYLKDLEKQEKDNTFDLLTKKEAALRRKELKKLKLNLDGVKTMSKLPDIVIIVDQKREMTAIKECRKLRIPIISIVDTNCDPYLITIPIPGNDDAVTSIKFILTTLTDGIKEGYDHC